jgi:hypothetical protein
MNQDAATDFVLSRISVTRELIARAKMWLVQNRSGKTDELVQAWLEEQNLTEIKEINGRSSDVEDKLTELGKSFTARLSFLQAIAELIGEGKLLPAGPWQIWAPGTTYSNHGHGGHFALKGLGCSHPIKIEPSPFVEQFPIDVDIFLEGVDCNSLHSGIHEAIEQSLACFRRGLYMPATAMLAAAAEATWSECATGVASNQSNKNLTAMVTDPHVGFGKIVSETVKALEHASAKPLLQKAGRSVSQLRDAVIWTTTLRDRRNALHWGKAKSFIADHSDTGCLLMAAPMHLKMLEAIRLAC